MDILINVSKQRLKLATNLKKYVAGSQDFVRFVFGLSSYWNDLLSFVQFGQDGHTYNRYLDDENSVFLPPEIEAGECTMTLFGSGSGVIATTNYLTLIIDENILVSDAYSTDISESLYEQLVDMVRSMGNGTVVANTKSEMTDKNKMYVYIGSETGMTSGNWYYWNGTAWTSGGVWNAVAVDTDTTLTISGKAADGAAAGELVSVSSTQPSATSNKLWIKPDDTEVEIPTMDDLNPVVEDVSNLKSDSLPKTANLAEQSRLDITGTVSRVVVFDKGLYDTSGYRNHNSWMHSQVFPAGVYSVSIVEGFRFAGYNYVSDSEGTVLFAGRIAPYTFTAPGPFVLDCAKSDLSILSEADVAAIKAGFTVVQTSASPGITTQLENNTSRLVSFLSDGNLFNHLTATYGVLLLNTGETTPQALSVTSDYIDVSSVDRVYVSAQPSMLCAYDENKEFLFYINNTANPKTIIVNGVHAYYIRITLSSPAIADNFIISTISNQIDKYGFYPTIGITGVNIDKDLAEWVHNNRVTTRNPDWESIGDNYAVTWRSCSGYTDYRKVFGRNKSIYVVNNVSTLADAVFTPVTEIDAVGICKIKVTVYVPDASLVTSMTVGLVGTSWTRAAQVTTGLNEIEFFTQAGSTATWETITGVRVYMSGTVGLSFYFIDCEFWRPEKATMILVEDGGYKTYLDVAYPQLKALGVPTTWALAPGRLGNNADPNRLMISQEEVDALADDPFSEFSFHSWNAEEGAELSGAELASYAQKCIYYLRKHGFAPEHLWRAAHTQNIAPNYAGEIGLVEALATGTQSATFTVWPFPNPWNVPRILIHGRSNEWYDTFFDTLRKTHCCAVIYTHGIDDASASMTSAQLEYFLGKLETAMEEGWLNPTTYNRLRNAERAL